VKIYKTQGLTEEVKELDFGITLAGDTKETEYYLYNDTEADVIDLKATVENPEVIIKECPQTIKSKTTGTIIFSWTPSLTLKRGLKTQLNLKFFELYS